MADKVGTDGQFYWFQGIVEDTDDPLQIGRVKIRHISEHNPSSKEYVETEDLPWAIPLMPVGSSSRFGVGLSPVGLDPGSYVVGFYLDGAKKTKPMILGSWPVFNEDENLHSVNRLARGTAPVEKEYLKYEPKTQYKAEYPFNKTVTTRRGHVVEIDDTPDGERIHIFHRNGSYIEMNPDGSIVTKSADKETNISMKDKLIAVDKGDLSIVVEKGDIKITAKDGNITIKASDDVNITAKNSTIKTEGTAKIQSESKITIKAPIIDIGP